MLDLKLYNFMLSRNPKHSDLKLHIQTILDLQLDCNIFEVYSPRTKYYYIIDCKKKK